MNLYLVLNNKGVLLRHESGRMAVYLTRKEAESHKRRLLASGCSRGFAVVVKTTVQDSDGRD